MRTLDASVRELVERAIELARRYAVWWQLVNKANFALNEAVVNDHEDFFATTSQALLESFSVITYQLYETGRNSLSIPSIIDALSAKSPTTAKELTSLIDRNRSLLAKAFAIRCGIYAHRSKKDPPETIFAAAGLSAREMERIVSLTAEIVASLAHAASVDTKEEILAEIQNRKTCAGDDTLLLMNTLREHAL